MADVNEPRECTLGPWDLKLTNISDEISHAMAETTYPYKNGADIEDMGVDPEVFRFSCIITNEDYKNNYSELRKWFLSYFPEPIELYHPDHDTILYGYPKNVSIASDKRRNYAEFQFDFEIADIQEEAQEVADPKYVTYEEAKEANAEVQTAIAYEMQKAGVPDLEGSDWSLVDVWGSLGDTARVFADGVSSAMAKIQGVIDTVKAPIDAINTTIDYMGTLSGKLTESLQGCCDSFTGLARRVTKSKSSMVVLSTNMSDMLATLAGSPVYAAYATLAAATLANEAANHISDDEKRMAESIASESVVSDNAEGHEIAETKPVYIVTPADMEDSVATVREFINSVLPVAICPDRLKKQAAALSNAILRIKMEYMTTKKVLLHHETPLHKVCLDNGLNYKAAERLCALNDVKNPTFMNGEVMVYAK